MTPAENFLTLSQRERAVIKLSKRKRGVVLSSYRDSSTLPQDGRAVPHTCFVTVLMNSLVRGDYTRFIFNQGETCGLKLSSRGEC
jgi:hypothetical protein